MTPPLPAEWRTDADLAAARRHIAAGIPGFEFPLAYGVAREDADVLAFGHVNEPGGVHRLPAVVLATVCGHTAGTATYVLDGAQLRRAVELLAPAKAAVHWEHPNLWSWRRLLAAARPGARFLAFFVGDLTDPTVSAHDAAFRARLPT